MGWLQDGAGLKRKIDWNKLAGYALGTGLVLFIAHNPAQPGMRYDAATQTHTASIFLPAIGTALIIGVVAAVILKSVTRADGKINVRLIDAGPRWIWIPLLVINASLLARLVIDPTMKTLSGGLIGLVFTGVYIAVRRLGSGVFASIAVAVVIEALSCIVIGTLVEPGIRTGGIISFPARNYAAATVMLVLGAVMATGKRQWLIVSVALIGLLFTGSGEAVLAVFVLVVVALLRRDWGLRMLVPVGAVVVVAVMMLLTGVGRQIIQPVADKLDTIGSGVVIGERVVPENPTGEYPYAFYKQEGGIEYRVEYEYAWEETLDNALFWRWTGWKRAVQNVSWLGHGYEPTQFDFYTVHNVPLIIVDQIGPVAAAAWAFLMIACLVKTRRKYAIAAILGLSLLDHFTWTMFAPWTYAILGVVSRNDTDDKIFTKEQMEIR